MLPQWSRSIGGEKVSLRGKETSPSTVSSCLGNAVDFYPLSLAVASLAQAQAYHGASTWKEDLLTAVNVQ